MTEPTHCPVVSFDHHSQEHGADPVASYRALRQAAPVAWSEAHGGYWVVSGYAGLFDAARDDATFSSARNSHGGEGLSVVIPKTPMHQHIPIEIDPPDFRKYRKIINLITSPSAAERMSDVVLEYTTQFIDDVIEAGECDFASVIGVPAAVTIRLAGAAGAGLAAVRRQLITPCWPPSRAAPPMFTPRRLSCRACPGRWPR